MFDLSIILLVIDDLFQGKCVQSVTVFLNGFFLNCLHVHDAVSCRLAIEYTKKNVYAILIEKCFYEL